LVFEVTATDRCTKARQARVELPHGTIETPLFMPVGTNGTVKAISHERLEEMGVNLILGNTYHLYLRPGIDVIRSAGGLHAFTSWKGNILTDSGGYQLFSLAPFRKITADGVQFRSHIDGSSHSLTPEQVVDLQMDFGSDILMALDVCTPPEIEYRSAVEALELTTTWARRGADRWRQRRAEEDYKGSLFGIVQGNFYKDLRKRSAKEILALDLPGVAIGGLSVGEPKETFAEFLAATAEELPVDRPRYVMGIGTPEYVFEAVENGIDLFDCVLPTRIARNGAAFTRHGILSFKRETHAKSFEPIDDRCDCRVCSRYTRAYLRQLFKTREILGAMLATEHNLRFMQRLLEDIRSAIRSGTFTELKKSFLLEYGGAGGEE